MWSCLILSLLCLWGCFHFFCFKSLGGEVCLHINRRWFSNVNVREQLCLPDNELLSVSVRPFYLPREFPQIAVIVVYIYPKADNKTAANTIFKVTQRLQSISPDAQTLYLVILIAAISRNVWTALSICHLPTRHKIYVMAQLGGLKSKVGPALVSLDHNSVHLLPVYRPVLRREQTINKDVKVGTKDSSLALQGCFDCVDYSVFFMTDRSQCVRGNGCSRTSSTHPLISLKVVSCTLLFIMYINENSSIHKNRHILKLADDSGNVSLLEGKGAGSWASAGWFCVMSLTSTVMSQKTKDIIVIVFRKSSPSSLPTVIKEVALCLIESYKYLGVVIDNKLFWFPCWGHLKKKVQ